MGDHVVTPKKNGPYQCFAVTGLGLCLLGAAWGAGPAQAGSVFDGPYVGGTVGYSDGGAKRAAQETSYTAGSGVLVDQKSTDRVLDLSGLSGEVFVGAGAKLGRVYVGLEALARYVRDRSHQSETATEYISGFGVVGPESVESELKSGPGYGAAVRIGGLLADNFLLYGRLGVVSTEFEFSQGNYKDDFRLTGGLIGAGGEYALTPWLALRADYSFTQYERSPAAVTRALEVIDVSIGAETHTLQPREHRFGVGLTFRPAPGDGAVAPAPIVEADLFDGFYFGFSAGYMDGGTDLSREDSFIVLNPSADVIETDAKRELSMDGFSGEAMAGAGFSIGRIYVGAEGVFGLSQAEQVNRVTDTDFSAGVAVDSDEVEDVLRQKNSYGFAVRLGWRVAERVLVYGRGGYVSTKFEFERSIAPDPSGDARLNYSADERLNGFLMGLGGEWAPGPWPWLRMRGDYTFTQYEDFSDVRFVSANVPGDYTQVTAFAFDPRQHRFGIGFVVGLN